MGLQRKSEDTGRGGALGLAGAEKQCQQINNGNHQSNSSNVDCLNTYYGLGRKEVKCFPATVLLRAHDYHIR